jgi:hypothetical protein
MCRLGTIATQMRSDMSDDPLFSDRHFYQCSAALFLQHEYSKC